MASKGRLAVGTAVLLMIPTCFYLGVWQLDRAEQAERRAAVIRERVAAPPLRIGESGTVVNDADYRRAEVTGRFEPAHRLWLEPRKQGGRNGVHLIEPLQVSGSELRVLVNRGWFPDTRRAPPATAEPVRLEGLLARPHLPPLRLDSAEAVWGERWPYLDLQRFARQYRVTVAPFVLIASPPLATERIEAAYAQADKWGMHIGYAVQWFVFGLLAFGLLVFLLRTQWRPVR